MTKRKGWKRVFLYVGILFLLIFLFVCFFGRFLVVDEEPVKSDVIIVLSGDEGRLEKGVSLWQEGYASALMVTRTDGRGGIPKETVARTGFPMSSFIPEYAATSTYTNALFTKEMMLERGFKSALVVSSNYHMRRTKFIFNKLYRDTGIVLTYVAADSTHFDPSTWWRKKVYVRFALEEYKKLAGYMVIYGKLSDIFR